MQVSFRRTIIKREMTPALTPALSPGGEGERSAACALYRSTRQAKCLGNE